MTEILKKEDYEEPCCPLSAPGKTASIPTGRVIEKLDDYFTKNDLAGAERHLRFWLSEAEEAGDLRGKLTVLNEQIGLYRRSDKPEEGLRVIGEALSVSAELHMERTVSHATTLINAATGYRTFGYPEKALPLYREAKEIYEASLAPDDARLGGLYNNMALTVMALGDFPAAEKLFLSALAVSERQEHGEAEAAITYLNLADLTSAALGAEAGEETINAYVQKAEMLLNAEGLKRDGAYAFVCEKCAPVFGHYGFFAAERELTERAEEIRERACDRTGLL